jgi:hypothetical protein
MPLATTAPAQPGPLATTAPAQHMPLATTAPAQHMPLATTAPAQPGPTAPTQPLTLTPIQVRFPHAGDTPRGPGAEGLPRRAWCCATCVARFAGIFAAWFNVPFTVLMAGIGALVGGVAGAVLRHDRRRRRAAPARRAAHLGVPTTGQGRRSCCRRPARRSVASSARSSAPSTARSHSAGWRSCGRGRELYRGDPSWPLVVALGQVAVAVFVGALYVLWSGATESMRMRVSGARRLSRREADWLMPIVHECAARLGPPLAARRAHRRSAGDQRARRHPAHRDQPGLLEQLDYDREAIGAVIAHELVHWRDGDADRDGLGQGVALPLFLLYELADRLLRLARSRPLHFIVRFLFWSVIVTTRYFVIPVQAGVWRQAEFRADAIVAAAGYGEGLRRALSYVRRSFDGERSGWDMAVLATHPPTELRLERLETPGRRYPLREDHPLVKALPGWSAASTVQKD